MLNCKLPGYNQGKPEKKVTVVQENKKNKRVFVDEAFS